MVVESKPQLIENDYIVQGKLGEGTFSQVLRMRQRSTGKVLAMKRFKKRFKSSDEIECLREVQALKKLRAHPNIVQMEDIIFDPISGTLYLAFELMDSNLYDLISKSGTVITEPKVRMWFFQLCKGLEYIHGRGIFHRDIKPENILINGNTIKIADLGSCRGTHSKGPYTEYIATRWYRPPEVLLTVGKYSSKMDIWGTGCVLYETITKQPLFPGSDSVDQLQRIHLILGTPTETQLRMIVGHKAEQERFSFPVCEGSGIVLPSPFNLDCQSLLIYLLTYVPDERFTATQALAHPFFKSIDLSVFPKSAQLIYQTTQHLGFESTKPSGITKLPHLTSTTHLNSLPSIGVTTQHAKKDPFNPILPTLIHPTILPRVPPHFSLQPKKPTEFQLPLPELPKPIHLPPPFLHGPDRKSSYYRKAEERKLLKRNFRYVSATGLS